MKRRCNRLGRRGANAIEVALTLPIFVVILAGTLDMGWMLYSSSVLDLAASRGCRAGALVDPLKRSPAPVARAAMEDWMAFVGASCETGGCDVRLEGQIPTQAVVCEASLELEPLWGLVVDATELQKTASVHLEIQRTEE